jgi:hypothetical protein
MDLTTREPQVMVGRTVKIATIAFAIAVGVHGLDHLRRGLDVVQVLVAVGGTLQMILTMIVVVLVLREHRWALTAATLLGFGSVVLFGSAHLLPHWGPISDSYINPAANAGVTTFSWVTAVLEIGMGLVLSTVAVRALRAQALT